MSTELQTVDGMQFDRATFRFTSSAIPIAWSASSKSLHILIHEKKISNMKDLLPVPSRSRA